MKFRRRSAEQPADPTADQSADQATSQGAGQPDPAGGDGADAGAGEGDRPAGPRDVGEVDVEAMVASGGSVDLGSLVITPEPGMQLRMQVDEQSQRVQAVLVTGPDGALEVMGFAAPRGGGLWDEVRPQIAADMARRGGTATERPGPWGTELECRITVQRADGGTVVQPSRIVGVDGPRWMLRATLLGRPAVDAEAAARWESVLGAVVVRRGDGPMPVGDQLPVVLPPQARPVS